MPAGAFKISESTGDDFDFSLGHFHVSFGKRFVRKRLLLKMNRCVQSLPQQFLRVTHLLFQQDSCQLKYQKKQGFPLKKTVWPGRGMSGSSRCRTQMFHDGHAACPDGTNFRKYAVLADRDEACMLIRYGRQYAKAQRE